MKTSLFILLSVVTFESVYAECVPARRVVDAPDELNDIGVYHRVHPSGNYVIASRAMEGNSENRVAVIDLSNPEQPRAIETPLIDEAYPIEGRWKYIASPRNNRWNSSNTTGSGMRYYPFEGATGVLEAGREAQYVMNDPDHDQWYHSSAELPGSTDQNFQFRTMLYGERYRDYTISTNANGEVTTTHTETRSACQNLTGHLSSPILSKDGTEVAANVGSSTVIYRINRADATCELVDDVGFYTSKVSFSYPNPPSKGQIAFQGNHTVMVDGIPQPMTGIFIYDRDTRTTRKISSNEGNPSYPGFTQDGRVIYMDRSNRKIITVDPTQLNADGSLIRNPRTCIQREGTATTGRERRQGSGVSRQ